MMNPGERSVSEPTQAPFLGRWQSLDKLVCRVHVRRNRNAQPQHSLPSSQIPSATPGQLFRIENTAFRT